VRTEGADEGGAAMGGGGTTRERAGVTGVGDRGGAGGGATLFGGGVGAGSGFGGGAGSGLVTVVATVEEISAKDVPASPLDARQPRAPPTPSTVTAMARATRDETTRVTDHRAHRCRIRLCPFVGGDPLSEGRCYAPGRMPRLAAGEEAER